MIGRKAASSLGKAISLAVSALVLLTAVLPRGAAAQEIRIERVGFSAPIGGVSAAAPASGILSGPGLMPGGAPSILAPSLNITPVPSAFAASAVPFPAILAAHATPAAAEGVFRSHAAAPAASAPSLLTGEESIRRNVPEASVALVARSPSAGSLLAAPSLESSQLAAAADGQRSAETDRDRAQRDFSALLGERLAEGKGTADAGTAVEAKPSGVSARLGSAGGAGSRLYAAVPAILALGTPGVLALAHPSLATWHVMGQVGYVAGNVGAAIFPLVQIYQTFHGKSTPKIRAIIGAAASLALGLISAPIMHKSLWGVQNIFGGVTLLVPLLIGALAGRVRGSGMKETALITAGALAVSAAAYFAVAATLPGLLAALLSAAAIAKITLIVQLATSAMFLWMFLPDTVKVLRGKAAGGFSPGFNLMFFLSAVGSMVWALPAAWIVPDANQGTYRMIFAVNAIYALASFISFWFARRENKPA